MHPAAPYCQSVSRLKLSKMINIAVVFSMIIVAVLSACNSPMPIANFDKKQYAGLWNIHAGVGKPILPMNPCFTLDISGDTKYSLKLSSKDNGGKIKTFIAQEVSSDGGVIKLSVGTKNLTYTVLDTDYKTYCSVHVCDVGADNDVVGVFLRSPKPDANLINEKLDAAQKILSSPLSPRSDYDFSNC
nr:unnamed protein product [Callosobruchus chinensis]